MLGDRWGQIEKWMLYTNKQEYIIFPKAGEERKGGFVYDE